MTIYTKHFLLYYIILYYYYSRNICGEKNQMFCLRHYCVGGFHLNLIVFVVFFDLLKEEGIEDDIDFRSDLLLVVGELLHLVLLASSLILTYELSIMSLSRAT